MTIFRILVGVMFLGFTLPALAEFPAHVTAPSGLVLRDTPAATGRQLALLPHGATCTAIDPGGREETIGGVKAHWWRIRAGGHEGWAFGAFLAPVPLAPASLQETTWFCDEGNGVQLTFMAGGKCRFDEAWDGGSTVEGTWSLAEGRVRLTVPIAGWSEKQRFVGIGPLSGTSVALPENLHGTCGISLSAGGSRPAFIFRNTISDVPSGAVRVFEGRSIVMLASRAHRTTSDAVLRDAPATTGKVLPTRLWDASRELPYLPRGTTVTALWRTEARSSAAGHNDYWYRVQVVTDREISPVETGWVFGAFLEALRE